MEKEGLKYNTERENLIISEYGRNIQIMIKHLLEIEDRKKRTDAAHFIVNIMAQMNPQVKESNDYLHKLYLLSKQFFYIFLKFIKCFQRSRGNHLVFCHLTTLYAVA